MTAILKTIKEDSDANSHRNAGIFSLLWSKLIIAAQTIINSEDLCKVCRAFVNYALLVNCELLHLATLIMKH